MNINDIMPGDMIMLRTGGTRWIEFVVATSSKKSTFLPKFDTFEITLGSMQKLIIDQEYGNTPCMKLSNHAHLVQRDRLNVEVWIDGKIPVTW